MDDRANIVGRPFTEIVTAIVFKLIVKKLQLTKVLLQLGLDGSTIIGSAYPSFSFGGRNSAEQ